MCACGRCMCGLVDVYMNMKGESVGAHVVLLVGQIIMAQIVCTRFRLRMHMLGLCFQTFGCSYSCLCTRTEYS